MKVEVNNDMSVLDLKEKLLTLTKISSAEIKLIFKGKIIKSNEEKLESLKIIEDSHVTMVHSKPTSFEEHKDKFEEINQKIKDQNPDKTFPNPVQNPSENSIPKPPNFAEILGNINPDMISNMMNNPMMMDKINQLMENPDLIKNILNTNPQAQEFASKIPGFDKIISDPNLIKQALSVLGNSKQADVPLGSDQLSNQNPSFDLMKNFQNSEAQKFLDSFSQNLKLNENSPPFDLSRFLNPEMIQKLKEPDNESDILTKLQKENEEYKITDQNYKDMIIDYKVIYKDQLIQLENKGFLDTNKNIKALNQTNGNVEKANIILSSGSK